MIKLISAVALIFFVTTIILSYMLCSLKKEYDALGEKYRRMRSNHRSDAEMNRSLEMENDGLMQEFTKTIQTLTLRRCDSENKKKVLEMRMEVARKIYPNLDEMIDVYIANHFDDSFGDLVNKPATANYTNSFKLCLDKYEAMTPYQ